LTNDCPIFSRHRTDTYIVATRTRKIGEQYSRWAFRVMRDGAIIEQSMPVYVTGAEALRSGRRAMMERAK
jgi:hypothetical protein